MKIIAVTQRIDYVESYGETRECLDVKWCELLREMGYIPFLVSSQMNLGEVFLEIDIKGILLTGGNDLSSVNDSRINRLRDDLESKLITTAIEKNIPILGVCRGMQMLTIHFGGSLDKVSNHIAVRHDLQHRENSSIIEITKEETSSVNSFHGYQVNLENNDEFILQSTCVDGTIESIMHRKYPFMGIMWHPEREEPFCAKDMELIKSIFM